MDQYGRKYYNCTQSVRWMMAALTLYSPRRNHEASLWITTQKTRFLARRLWGWSRWWLERSLEDEDGGRLSWRHDPNIGEAPTATGRIWCMFVVWARRVCCCGVTGSIGQFVLFWCKCVKFDVGVEVPFFVGIIGCTRAAFKTEKTAPRGWTYPDLKVKNDIRIRANAFYNRILIKL